MVAGLLLNTTIVGGLVARGEQPGMRIRSSSRDKDRMKIFFNLVTSKILWPATSICHYLCMMKLNYRISFAAAIGDDFVATDGSKFILS